MKNPCYAPSILPLMQTLLATLADIDFAHQCELQRVAESSADAALKERLRADLEARHRERRAPYVEQLVVLEARTKAALTATDCAPGAWPSGKPLRPLSFAKRLASALHLL